MPLYPRYTIRARFFSTYTWGPTKGNPERQWVDVVRRHARWLAVRLIGPADWFVRHEPAEVEGWENCAYILAREGGKFRGNQRMAYLYVNLHNQVLMPSNPLDKHEPEMRDRTIAAFQWLRGNFPYSIAVFAEDFAARWFVMAGLAAELLVLDGPVLTAGEIRASAAASCPGYVRTTSDIDWTRWADRTSFNVEDRATGIVVRSLPGVWRPTKITDQERLACRSALAESLH